MVKHINILYTKISYNLSAESVHIFYTRRLVIFFKHLLIKSIGYIYYMVSFSFLHAEGSTTSASYLPYPSTYWDSLRSMGCWWATTHEELWEYPYDRKLQYMMKCWSDIFRWCAFWIFWSPDRMIWNDRDHTYRYVLDADYWMDDLLRESGQAHTACFMRKCSWPLVSLWICMESQCWMDSAQSWGVIRFRYSIHPRYRAARRVWI